ncbi:unnamed protein product [Lepidochelys kempii]
MLKASWGFRNSVAFPGMEGKSGVTPLKSLQIYIRVNESRMWPSDFSESSLEAGGSVHPSMLRDVSRGCTPLRLSSSSHSLMGLNTFEETGGRHVLIPLIY